MEKWCLISRFDNKYAVSNTGFIKSIKKNKILTQHGGKDYKKSNVTFKGRSYRVTIHREVADAFLSGENKDQVNHIDGNKHNNSSDNLQWCTRLENMRHSWEKGLRSRYATKQQKISTIKNWLKNNKIEKSDLIKILEK